METEKNINLNEEPEINFKVEKFEYSPEAELLREKVKLLKKKNADYTTNKIASFGRELQTRYPMKELHNYETYRFLVGSGARKKPEKFDLEGGDSIEHFINSLEEEISR